MSHSNRKKTENGYITRLPRKKDYMPLPSNKEEAASGGIEDYRKKTCYIEEVARL